MTFVARRLSRRIRTSTSASGLREITVSGLREALFVFRSEIADPDVQSGVLTLFCGLIR